jgi:hypothetical protein
MGRQKQNAERCEADAGMFDALMLATGNTTQHNTTQRSKLDTECAMRNAQCAMRT